MFTAPFPDHHIFQCDLAGADGWTVACHCASLGDATMLEDYRFGLKPANIIANMYQHGAETMKWTREQFKAAAKSVDKNGWLYFACKRVQHASNYKVSPPTIQDTVLKDSYKLGGEPIFIPIQTCERLQMLYYGRYSAVPRWHMRCSAFLNSTGQLKSASGHTRTFFGRKQDVGTLKEYLADEPQENTTWCCNMALWRSWNDPENRECEGQCEKELPFPICECEKRRLIVKPMHQMHDAVIGCFPTDRTEWALPKIKSYFDNPITIAGITVTVPFEGGYGRSWGELDNNIPSI